MTRHYTLHAGALDAVAEALLDRDYRRNLASSNRLHELTAHRIAEYRETARDLIERYLSIAEEEKAPRTALLGAGEPCHAEAIDLLPGAAPEPPPGVATETVAAQGKPPTAHT